MKEYKEYLTELGIPGAGGSQMASRVNLLDASRATDLQSILDKAGIESVIDPGRKNISFEYRGKRYEIIPVG